MAKSIEEVLSLKDFDPNSTHIVSKAKKRNRVMENNMKASLLIVAAKKIRQDKQEADIHGANLELRTIIDTNVLPREAYLNVFDGRIKSLSKKVNNLLELKEAQNGWLKDSQENTLKALSPELEAVKMEKEVFLEREATRIARDKILAEERAVAAKKGAQVEIDATKKYITDDPDVSPKAKGRSKKSKE